MTGLMKQSNITVIRSDRKTVSAQVLAGGKVLVRCPKKMTEQEILRFLDKHKRWLSKRIAQNSDAQPPFTPEQVDEYVKKAKNLVPTVTAAYARIMGVQVHKITIRRQRTRWGSCSSKGNLNFNCLLAAVPFPVMEYVVVHELCHLKQMNHSPAFWAQVERILPDYKIQKQWLKDYGSKLIQRL